MDLNEVAVFIKVIQLGSFSKAAIALEMPNSTVSSKVSMLEKRLGVTLIQRTTRKLNITPAGQEYFKRCLLGVAQIEAAENEILVAKGEPQGLLRITAPIELGSVILPNLISRYTKKYPKVSVEVILADRYVDLLGEGVDLAIRAGELKDSSLIAKKLGEVNFALFATAKYLKSKSVPTHPKELQDHACIQFTAIGREGWKLNSGKNSIYVTLNGKTIINDLNMVKNLAINNMGIALMPTFFCHIEVNSGKLIRVLPEWRTNLNPVHFVYPAQKFVTPKLSAFIELASEEIKNSLIEFID